MFRMVWHMSKCWCMAWPCALIFDPLPKRLWQSLALPDWDWPAQPSKQLSTNLTLTLLSQWGYLVTLYNDPFRNHRSHALSKPKLGHFWHTVSDLFMPVQLALQNLHLLMQQPATWPGVCQHNSQLWHLTLACCEVFWHHGVALLRDCHHCDFGNGHDKSITSKETHDNSDTLRMRIKIYCNPMKTKVLWIGPSHRPWQISGQPFYSSHTPWPCPSASCWQNQKRFLLPSRAHCHAQDATWQMTRSGLTQRWQHWP